MQDNISISNYIKVKINKTHENNKCRISRNKEIIDHIGLQKSNLIKTRRDDDDDDGDVASKKKKKEKKNVLDSRFRSSHRPLSMSKIR